MGGQKLGVTVQQPAQIQNTPINVAGKKCFSKSWHISLIQYLGNSTKVPSFLQVSPRKIENLISGGPNKSEGWISF